MGRPSDAAGKSGYLSQLGNGYMTRREVMADFLGSVEFNDICDRYGIVSGTYVGTKDPVGQFVSRFYVLCLERQPDQAGLEGWVGQLKNQHMDGADIAEQFFFCEEFTEKNTSDEKFVELLYNTLMGRPSDAVGKSGYLSQLENGYMTRREVMKSFVESNEFTEICESYGITRGTIQ